MKIKSVRLSDREEIMLKEITKFFDSETHFKITESDIIKFLIEKEYEELCEKIKQKN